MAYNIYRLIYGFRVLGTLNWDLRWIMTRALLRDTRSFSYRSLWLEPNIHLDYWSSDCGHQKVFRLRMLYTKHDLDLRQLTLGIGKLVNGWFADLEVYMPNDQS